MNAVTFKLKVVARAPMNVRTQGRVLFCDEDFNQGLIHGDDNKYYRFDLDQALYINPGDTVAFDALPGLRERDNRAVAINKQFQQAKKVYAA